jgi:hypothetical protein
MTITKVPMEAVGVSEVEIVESYMEGWSLQVALVELEGSMKLG